jgi:hypothetical protein
MRDSDWQVLEKTSIELEQSGLTATAGQIASQLLHDAIAGLASGRTHQVAASGSPALRVSDGAKLVLPASSTQPGAERLAALRKAREKGEKKVAA